MNPLGPQKVPFIAKKPAIRVVLASLVFVAAFAPGTFKLVAPDRSFAVTFPGEPRHESSTSDSGPFHVEAHAYSLENPDWKYILSYVKLSPLPRDLTPSQALDSAISGTIENVRGKLVSQQAIEMAGKPAKAVKIQVGDNTVIDGRFVYANSRVYQLLVLHRPGAQPQFMQSFFDSFSLQK
jgi:hypothetical protein